MGGLFSKKKKTPKKMQVSDAERAQVDLKRAKGKLHKLQKQSVAIIERQVALARQLMREGKRERAMLCMRRKKFHEKQIAGTEAKMLNIEEQIARIAEAEVNAEVFKSLETSNAAIKAIQATMTIEDVERVMDESAEGQAYMDEISEMLGNSLTAEEDAEAEAEMEALMKEMDGVDVEKLPDAPQTQTQTVVGEDPAGQEVAEAADQKEPEVVMA